MPEVRNFHEKLENDLQRLTVEVQSHRERPESKELSEREIVRKSLEVFQPAPAEAPEPAPLKASGTSSVLPSYIGDSADPKVKAEVERLAVLAFQEGIEKAVREAKKAPPFIADAFHDALVDKLLPELRKRGII